jgi:hypothetical protein
MFRPLAGFKAQYQDLTLMVVSEFDEWRVIVYSPALILQGTRQYTSAKAKDHAALLAKSYVAEIKQEAAGDGQEIDWQPTGPMDWLVWKA